MGELMKRWVCVCALVVGGGCTDVTDSTGGEPVGVGFDGFSTADIATADCGSALDGAPCDDGNPCTLDDQCEQGLCVGATSNPCDSEGPCNPGNCDPVQGCVYTQVEDGTPCALGCFGSATCEQGSCVAVADSAVLCPEPDDPCVDQLQCEASTGECTREIYALAGTACNTDDNWCSLESCDGQGACLDDQETQTCSAQTAADQCWTFECDPLDGECKEVVFVEGVSCDDGNPCTQNDMCTVDPVFKKLCLGTPVPVDDGNPCTDDKCVGGTVEHLSLDGVPCDDGDPCSLSDVCEEGLCVAGTLDEACELQCESDSECDDEDACTDDACVDGTCAFPPIVCDDGDPCTDDACVDGACASEPLACDDGDPCTDDACVDGACAFTAVDCNDGGVCATGTCVDGVCEYVEGVDEMMIGACADEALAEPVLCAGDLPSMAEKNQAVFVTTGGDQTFVVPEGVSTIHVKAWGAGGGSDPTTVGGPGGAGGFAFAELVVTPGESLTVMVGEGGLDGFLGWPGEDEQTWHYGGGGHGGLYAGNGGGRSAIRRDDNELLTAGGGGGAASCSELPCGAGGAGGLPGEDGQSSPVTDDTYGEAGTGATAQCAGDGGLTTCGCGWQSGAGSSGYPFKGGSTIKASSGQGGAGGGGGRFGGGSGGGDCSGFAGGGGGGGSCWAPPDSGCVLSGSGTTPGNASDPTWDGLAGVGADPGQGGAGGLVVIAWGTLEEPECQAASDCDDQDPCTDNACVDGACVFDAVVCDAGGPCTTGTCVNGACEYVGGDEMMIGECVGQPLPEPVQCAGDLPLLTDQNNVVFDATGGDQSFIVPEGVSTIQVKAWGAGGGSWNVGQGGAGGAGGFAYAELAVTAGEALTVMVGARGFDSFDETGIIDEADGQAWNYGGGGRGGYYAGNGGGRSAIRRGDDELVTAGGGGGAGGCNIQEASCGGGGAGGLPGEDGENSPLADESYGEAGTGATNQCAGEGGLTTCGCGWQSGAGSGGYLFKGGSTIKSATGQGGGGGGGGRLGGGSGGGDCGGNTGGGGGGGSCWAPPENGCVLSGVGTTPGNASDPAWDGAAGVGGDPGQDGADGLVLIAWEPVAECQGAADCDDQDPCTENTCVEGDCVFNGVVCDDSDACTTDTCVDGGCVFTTMNCNDGGPCTTGFCVEGACEYVDGDAIVIGACAAEPLPEPLLCVDGLPLLTDQDHTVFSSTGGDQTFLVPDGVSTIQVKAWGAGGGSYSVGSGGTGGAGGFAYAELPVTAGETLTVIVGDGGLDGFFQWGEGDGPRWHYGGGGSGGLYGANGGGRSALRRGDDELVTAAGGGGGGNCSDPPCGVGGAGGLPGEDGQSSTLSDESYGEPGTGATNQCAGDGGITTCGCDWSSGSGMGGQPFKGGATIQAAAGQGSGGGGGGRFGGGSSGGDCGGLTGGGGGGGSCWAPPESGCVLSGSGTTPGNASDPAWDGAAGVGGASGQNGAAGLVIIAW